MPRPSKFSEFHGQAEHVRHLQVAVAASKRRNRVFGHTLLSGPPGVGKTTLGASVIPTEVGCGDVKLINCTAIDKPQDILPVITTRPPGSFLVLDEVHALKPEICELLYHVLEDCMVTVVIGEDKDRQTLNVELPKFTIVAATTRLGLLPEPFVSRFEHQIVLDNYTDEEMAQVLIWTLSRIDNGEFTLTPTAVEALASACQGTARNAERLLQACIDTTVIENLSEISLLAVRETLRRIGYVGMLTGAQYRLVECLKINNVAGLQTLSAYLDEEARTIEDSIEPWLIRSGFMVRTSRGRELTTKGSELFP